jgi:hypothetical protein
MRLPCAGADRPESQVQALPPELRGSGRAWTAPFLHYEPIEESQNEPGFFVTFHTIIEVRNLNGKSWKGYVRAMSL